MGNEEEIQEHKSSTIYSMVYYCVIRYLNFNWNHSIFERVIILDTTPIQGVDLSLYYIM